MPVPPTGYCYFGWLLPDCDMAATEFGGTRLELRGSTTHLSGQVSDDDITIEFHGAVRHILAEFTATGFYELFGLSPEPWTNVCAFGNTVCTAMASAESSLFNDSANFSLDDIESHIELFSSVLCAQSAHTISAPDYISQAVSEIEQCNGVVKLSELAEKLAISSRQLNRKFTDIVGISPKYFARILQVNRVVRAMLENDTTYFADVAQAYGFYDQSHLINTTKSFLGTTPSKFLQSDEDILFTFLGKSRKAV